MGSTFENLLLANARSHLSAARAAGAAATAQTQLLSNELGTLLMSLGLVLRPVLVPVPVLVLVLEQLFCILGPRFLIK